MPYCPHHLLGSAHSASLASAQKRLATLRARKAQLRGMLAANPLWASGVRVELLGIPRAIREAQADIKQARMLLEMRAYELGCTTHRPTRVKGKRKR